MAAFSMASMSASLSSVEVRLPRSRASTVRPAKFAVAPRNNAACMRSFTGMKTDAVLSLGVSASETPVSVQNGALVFAMRHRYKKPRLGRPADQRKALLRGLCTELLRNGRITTTTARAKAMRPYVEHMVTLAKGGSLHQRRQALAYIYDKQLVHALFEEVPNRYGERAGGYTRIFQTLNRQGDNAPMSIIELV